MTPLSGTEPHTESSGSGTGSTGSAGTIRVVIADDHAVVRRGLRQVLDIEEGF